MNGDLTTKVLSDRYDYFHAQSKSQIRIWINRLNAICLSALIVTSFVILVPVVASADQKTPNDREYWIKFVADLDKILATEQADLRPIDAFLATIDTRRSRISSEGILLSSKFSLDHTYSGLSNVYDYANSQIIVRIYFDKVTGFCTPEQTGARLKKTAEDYKIVPK